jgi:predicted porin
MKTILKTSVAAAALMAVAAPAMAQNLTREAGRDKVALKIYGQVNRMMMWGDDGNDSRLMSVDNAASSTRFGLTATAPVNADLTFGAQIETEFMSNASSSVSIGSTAVTSTTLDNNQGQATFTERVMEVTVDHKRFGKISLGQGGVASDGIAEHNLSGATNVNGSLTVGFGNSFRLFDSVTNTTQTTTLGQVAAYFDGPRDDRVRYDTPKFMNTWLSGSFSSGGPASATIRHDAKYGQFKVVGGVGYNNQSGLSTTIEDEVSGSIAVLHDSGLNAFISAGTRNHKDTLGGAAAVSRHDADYIAGGIGYLAKIFGVGPTAFAADYWSFNNINASTTSAGEWEADQWGIGVEQQFSDIGASAYLGYRNTDFSLPAPLSIDDVNVVVAGMRVVF